MNTIMQRFGLMVSGVLTVVGIWACQATRNSDGSITITFAPDMVIRAWGLEDALCKLIDLRAQCASGAFPRPCTPEETDSIERTIWRVLDSKDRLLAPEARSSAGVG